MVDYSNYGLPMNDQSCYQQDYADDDIVYWKLLVDVAEQLRRIHLIALYKIITSIMFYRKKIPT
jgi:hypothetical protein